MQNLSVVGNRAIGKPSVDANTGKTVYTGGNSGGMMIRNSSLKTNGQTKQYYSVVNAYGIYVAENKSNTAAGGILVQSSGAKFALYNSTVTKNESASSDGGGMYFSSGVVVHLQDVTVSENKANAAAGMNIYGCTLTADGLKVCGNTSNRGAAGFAVVGKTAVATVKNAEIYDNTAGGAGGGLVVQTGGTLHMENGSVYRNTTETMGGGGYFASPSYVSFKNVEVYENTSKTFGGGFSVYVNGIAELENVTIRNNATAGNGGAVYVRGRFVAANSKLLNNQAEKGGALASDLSSGDYLNDEAGSFLTGCVLSGNEAIGQGGAVYNHRGGPVYLTDTVITDNICPAEGSAIYSNGRLGLETVTVTGNVSQNNGHAVYVTAAEFDGHSYTTGHKKVSGDLIIRDNEGGNLYLCENALLTVVGQMLGEHTYVDVTLQSGILRQHVLGIYGYEGGNLHYIITAGDRSVTDPEELSQEPAPAEDNTMLYAGVGVIGALIVLAAAAVVVGKKKKAQKSERN